MKIYFHSLKKRFIYRRYIFPMTCIMVNFAKAVRRNFTTSFY
jgi:hypothetical protein